MHRLFAIGLALMVWVATLQPVKAFELNQYGFERSGNFITQTFIIQAPSLIPLNFGYCNGQSCGNPQDPELWCYVNLYNPSWPGELPHNLTIGGLPAGTGKARPIKLYAKSGQLAGGDINYGYYDTSHTSDWNKTIFRSQPVFNSDGSVTLQFSQGPFDQFVNAKISPKGRVCGLNEEEIAAFRAQYGTVFDNTDRATIKIAIVWETDLADYANPQDQIIQQNIDIDNRKQTVNETIPPQPEAFDDKTTLYRQVDDRWASLSTTDQAFAETGTIPTSLANVLSRFDETNTPDQVTQELTAQGIQWNKGASWQQLTNYLTNSKKLHVSETTTFGAVQHLAQGQPVMAAMTTSYQGQPKETIVMLESYNTKKDKFTLVDPVKGHTTITWNELMQGTPWFMTVTK